MASNVTLPAQGTGDTQPVVATEEIAGAQVQLLKPVFGAAGVATKVSSTTPFPVSAKTDLTPNGPTFASVGVASAQALAANATRKGLVLVNTSQNLISLAFGVAAVLGSGISLVANGGTWTMDEHTFTTAEVRAIAGGAASNLSIQEFQ